MSERRSEIDERLPTNAPKPEIGQGVGKDVAALLIGLRTTLQEFFRPVVTLEYPEQKSVRSERYRGRHYLRRYDNGLERCIGCELCAANCPVGCILVIAAENLAGKRVSPGERYAKVYEINMLRCIFCGYCEEACPVQAITLGPEYELANVSREQFIYTKDMLLEPLPPEVEARLSAREGGGIEGFTPEPLAPQQYLPGSQTEEPYNVRLKPWQDRPGEVAEEPG